MGTPSGPEPFPFTIAVPRRWVAAASATLAIGAAAVIADAPSIVGFTAAIIAAAIWCRWLEHHPEN